MTDSNGNSMVMPVAPYYGGGGGGGFLDGGSGWWLILLLALMTCLAGAIMIFLPTEGSMLLSIWIGVSLLSGGIMNLIVAICTVKVVENQKADIIEGDYIEN